MPTTTMNHRHTTGGGGVGGRSRPLISSAVLGTLIFVATEVMYFTALISAYLVIKSGYGDWSPPQGVTLPVAATAFNTAVLLASGVQFYRVGLHFAGNRNKALALFAQTALFGAFFVLFQGYEWVQLISYGMTMKSGVFGACFFLLIGSHAIHVAAAVAVLWVLYQRFKEDRLTREQLRAMQIFWYFVVGVWPILYGLVYF